MAISEQVLPTLSLEGSLRKAQPVTLHPERNPESPPPARLDPAELTLLGPLGRTRCAFAADSPARWVDTAGSTSSSNSSMIVHGFFSRGPNVQRTAHVSDWHVFHCACIANMRAQSDIARPGLQRFLRVEVLLNPEPERKKEFLPRS